MQPLVTVYRGDLTESVHLGSIAVVESSGKLLALAGDPDHQTFLRSAAKPFQALPMLQEGGIDEFDLTPEEIALTCASHGGEPSHVATVASLLRKGDYDESDLLCAAHVPYDEKAAADLRATSEAPSPLQNNCSGKHAGMLLACSLLDAPSGNYVEPQHVVQIRAGQALADFAGIALQDIPHAIDGCGLPSYYVSLYRAALAYARFSATAQNLPQGLPRYSESAREVWDAMTSRPHHVAGNWSITTPLLEAFDGGLLAKEGAEGFYSMALAPELCERLTDRIDRSQGATVGIAMKVADGSMGRGRNPAILRTLELLGLELESLGPLGPYRDLRITNAAGKVVGELRSEFELHYL